MRVAVEKLLKTGAEKRPFPKQRYSSKTYTVAKILQRKVGVARYQLSTLPRQRFEREDLLLVGGRATASEMDPDPAVRKLASKRTAPRR